MLFRFLSIPVLQIFGIAVIVADPKYLAISGLFYILFAVLIDGFIGENNEVDNLKNNLPDYFVYLSVPLHLLIMVYVTLAAPQIMLYPIHIVLLIVVSVGIYNTLIGAVIAHELMHKGNAFAFLLAQFCLAFSFLTSGAIDHVYGHHKLVGLRHDNTTARKGESLWNYIIRAIAGENRFAINHETARLARRKKAFWSIYNRVLAGYLICAVLIILSFVLAGSSGVILFVSAGLFGLVFIEAGNYISHYGLIRVAGRPIELRHSWNSFNLISTSFLLNSPRHSEHHLFSRKPYWTLERCSRVPIYPLGFAAMTVLALIPPLFFRIVHRRLNHWEKNLASEPERAYLTNFET